MASSSSSTSSAPTAPKPPIVQPGSGNNIVVNSSQRLNPLLDQIKNVGREFGDIVADYQVGRTTGVLFLSLKYHRLHPEYIHQRIERLGHSYGLRILLLMCDVSEHQEPIRELTKTCLINNITVIVAWSIEEAGQYLSTFKQFEHRPPDMIKERVENDYNSLLRSALTSISKVNKTDVETLRTTFGSFAKIASATTEQLQNLPGFGQVKVRRIKDAFEKPFRNNATSALRHGPMTVGNPTSSQTPATSTSAKGKEKETLLAPVGPSAHTAGPARAPSEPWDDIDFDMDLSPSPTPESGPPLEGPRGASAIASQARGSTAQSTASEPPALVMPSAVPQRAGEADTARRKRSPSPVWDIELDLNLSDADEAEDDDRYRKRRKGEGFGTPGLLAA